MYKILAPPLRLLLKGHIVGKRIAGTNKTLYYDPSQHLAFLWAKEIRYEPAISGILLDQVQPGALVFEIGSNIGQYSLQISEKLGSQGKLICIEPDSDNYKMLSRNVIRNDCRNVILVNKAVSDTEGIMRMYKDTTTGGRMSSLIKEFSGMHKDGKTEEVQVTTFKALIEIYSQPAFVKLDVEGAECLVLSDFSCLTKETNYIVEVR